VKAFENMRSSFQKKRVESLRKKETAELIQVLDVVFYTTGHERCTCTQENLKD
jgi:hypothetical protein